METAAIVLVAIAVICACTTALLALRMPLTAQQENARAIMRLCDTVDTLCTTLNDQSKQTADRILAAANPLGFQSVKSYESKPSPAKRATRVTI